MSDVGVVVLLFVCAVLVLAADLFLPSHGLLSLVGLGLLVAAVVWTFRVGGQRAGIYSIYGSLVFLPVFAFIAVKVWPHTPIGKRIAPKNPIVTASDTSVPVNEMRMLVGTVGRCVTDLRPVGVCDFAGQRVSCVSQFGMINAGTMVQAIGFSGPNLTVAEVKA